LPHHGMFSSSCGSAWARHLTRLLLLLSG